jgi:hypothetical protein
LILWLFHRSIVTIADVLVFCSTIKPPKKPEEEVKREPTPELARISALVTRPPKQKSTSKKAEDGLLEAYATLPSEASLSSASLVPALRAKKPVFKALPRREPSPNPPVYVQSLTAHSLALQEGMQFCFTVSITSRFVEVRISDGAEFYQSLWKIPRLV